MIWHRRQQTPVIETTSRRSWSETTRHRGAAGTSSTTTSDPRHYSRHVCRCQSVQPTTIYVLNMGGACAKQQDLLLIYRVPPVTLSEACGMVRKTVCALLTFHSGVTPKLCSGSVVAQSLSSMVVALESILHLKDFNGGQWCCTVIVAVLFETQWLVTNLIQLVYKNLRA